MKCGTCKGNGVITYGFGIENSKSIDRCPVCNGEGDIKDSDAVKIAIIFDRWFLPTDELNEFCKSIGYENPDYSNDFDLMFDQRIVQFCQGNLSSLFGEQVYKGRNTCDFKCGFAGAGHIRAIDTSKTWRLDYNRFGSIVIDYVDISTNKYGYLSVL